MSTRTLERHPNDYPPAALVTGAGRRIGRAMAFELWIMLGITVVFVIWSGICSTMGRLGGLVFLAAYSVYVSVRVLGYSALPISQGVVLPEVVGVDPIFDCGAFAHSEPPSGMSKRRP